MSQIQQDLLFLILALCATPLACALPVVLYRRARGVPKSEVLSKPTILFLADAGWGTIAAGLAILPFTLPDPLSEATRWAAGSGLLVGFLLWRWLCMILGSRADPWASFAAAGAQRFISFGSLAVGSMLLINVLVDRSFPACLLGVLWFPVVAIVGWLAVRRASIRGEVERPGT
jgi:hypothetical protein